MRSVLRSSFLCYLAILYAPSLISQTSAATVSTIPARSASSNSSNGFKNSSFEEEVSRELRNLREDNAARIASEERVSQAIAGLKPNYFEKLTPALIGLLGVSIAGLLAWAQQRRQLASNLEVQKRQSETSVALQTKQLDSTETYAKAKSGYESLAKRIDYRSRQLDEFYFPMKLRLLQTAWVRRQLCDQLNELAPGKFIFSDTESDGRRHLYVKFVNQKPRRFRLVEHMKTVAEGHREVLPLIREIVSIGETMTKLIHDKGGLLLIEDPSRIDETSGLSELIGRYLAHFSILREVARRAVEEPATLALINYNVTYPNALDGALAADIVTISKEIEAWRSQAASMWVPSAVTT